MENKGKISLTESATHGQPSVAIMFQSQDRIRKSPLISFCCTPKKLHTISPIVKKPYPALNCLTLNVSPTALNIAALTLLQPFDMRIDELKKYYGDPYNAAYDEIRQEMDALGFDWTQGSLYIAKDSKDSLATVYKAINHLSHIEWFKKSVRDIRAFKVEDWSDFTAIVKDAP